MDNEQEPPVECLDWDSAKLDKETSFYLDHVYYDAPRWYDDEFWAEYEEPQLTQLKERLALYPHEISEGWSLRDFAELRRDYPPSVLEELGYFEHDRSFEWYFDPENCYCVGFQDYQRLVLHKQPDYHNWEKYCTTNDTYEDDRKFVKYYEKLASETKWIENYLTEKKLEWGRINCMAFYQAAKIAAGFGGIRRALVYFCFTEFAWSVWFDYSFYKVPASLYFEIWKCITKQKMNFLDALKQIHEQGTYPSLSYEMKCELNLESSSMKNNYGTYAARIDEKVQEDRAHMLIMEAITKFVPKQKTYYDYVKRKLNVEEEIGLIPPENYVTNTSDDNT